MENQASAIENLETLFSARRIKKLTLPQRMQSEKILNPHIGDIIDMLELVRLDIDREFIKSYEENPQPRFYHIQSPSRYPVGHCEPIRDGTMQHIINMVKNDVDVRLPAMQAIGKVVCDGIPFGKVHGIMDYGDGKAFQNAIQVGHLIMDTGIDTLAGTGRRVDIYDIDSGILKNVDDYFQYAEVVRKYWGLDVVSTARYLPNIAPLFPVMLSNRATGVIEFAKYDSLFYGNIRQNFNLSEDVARKADEFDHLPPVALNRMRARFRKSRNAYEWQEGRTQFSDIFNNHRKLFHPLFNGAEEPKKRELVDGLMKIYNISPRLN